MFAIILSGGSGSRLWPLSRESHPKQFLSFNSHLTLFQETLLRLSKIGLDVSMVICNQENRFVVTENLITINCYNTKIILEPCTRNTAPAIAIAALFALNSREDPTLLILPSDHLIQDVDVFKNTVKAAEDLAKKGYLVTLGISPTHPNTEYGYIECGQRISNISYKVSRFKEKPNKEVATKFLKQGNCLWNSGIYIFKASTYLDALAQYCPKLLQQAKATYKHTRKYSDYITLDENSFTKCDNISIDYAIMEKSKDAVVVKFDAEWSDVGTWQSVWEISQKDLANNVCKGDIIIEECQNSFFYSESRLITAVGINNLIIVDTKDALLVTDKSTGSIKKLVARLQQEKRTETKSHMIIYKPWGHYDTICRGERDVVKRITVKPGAKLSRQMHYHRAEHWIVVKGTAKVLKGKEELLISENESIYLPFGIKHSLENPGKIPLEIIEVQTGSYLEEDDIVRFEDKYGRL